MEARDLVPGSRVALIGPGSVAYALVISGPARRPRDHHHRDALPRTPTGKVRRLELTDLVTRTG